MQFGSLFTGIGGFDLGLERAGMTCAWQCEIDPACREVLARHFPSVPCFEDVKELHVERGSVDLICGGFPCQDLSVAGRRKGLAGERSGLWHEFHRVLTAARPEWCVIENVPGLLSSRRGNDFAVVLRGLVELGYGVCWRVLDAQYFGVPQRRRRVFIVGHLGDGRAAQVLFEPESVCGNPPARRKAGEETAGTLGGGAGSRGWADDTDRMTFVAGTLSANGGGTTRPAGNCNELDFCVPVVSPAPSARDYKGPSSDGDGDGAPLVVHALTAEGHDASEDGTGRGTPLVFQPRCVRNGRGNPDTMAAALTSEAGRTGKGDSAQCVASGMAVRRLTPTECERLQGFPDGWTEGFADGPRYRMMGNAVAVPVAEWLGRRIVEAG